MFVFLVFITSIHHAPESFSFDRTGAFFLSFRLFFYLDSACANLRRVLIVVHSLLHFIFIDGVDVLWIQWTEMECNSSFWSSGQSTRFGVEAKARRMSEAHKAVIIIEDAVRGG